MAAVVDTLVGAAVEALLSTVIEKKDRAIKFRSTLENLEITLTKLKPLIEQIENFNRKLDRPKNETEDLINQMNKGAKLVIKCSKVQWWECCYKANYQEQLEELNQSIRNYFDFDNQVLNTRDIREIAVGVREIQNLMVLSSNNHRVELKGLCSSPQPPAFTVGLDVTLKQLKMKLLNEEVGVPAVVTVTGPGGSGKSTLAKKLCWDEEIKGKFKDNIFYITFAKFPKLHTLVHRLFQHTGYQVPDEFQSDEDAVNQLENLMNLLIQKSPVLLVLDDVWPGAESLVDKFVFENLGYKILVTSRVAIGRFGSPYVLKPLGGADALKLFKHSASLNKNSSVPDDVVKQIVKSCGGSPLALRVSGRSLSQQHQVVWRNKANELSKGRSIIESSSDVLECLQKCFDLLDPKAIECFKDLALFPEDQRIPAYALVDIWTELYDDDDDDDDVSAMENIYQLVNWNMADILVTRKVEGETTDYSYHYVMQHDLLRELAIHQSSQEPEAERNRLIFDITGNNLPKWWKMENEYQIKARILSISTDESFTSEWCNLKPSEVEALVLNLRAKKCTLPIFLKKMGKLKVLIITNYDSFPIELENFELLDYLSQLKRLRLEKVSIPFISKTGVQLKNLHKITLFMCNVNEAFKNCTNHHVSDILPNLVEMNIEYCNMVELPFGFSNIVSLKKLKITKCHKLSSLPKGMEKLVNLESLKLSSCTNLSELPESITSLEKLKILDISDCIKIKLPENIGNLSGLQTLNVRGCSSLSELPESIMELGSLRNVICDEEIAILWEDLKSINSNLRIEVVQASSNLELFYNLYS